MADWSNLVSVASAVSGIAAGVATSLTAARASKRQREDVQRLDTEAQDRAINSSDMATLGRYLLEDIGTVRVSDVVSDKQVRSRTWQAFSRVAQFVGEPGDADADAAADGAGRTGVGGSGELTSEELRIARERILGGEVWNGLALMRRHVEMSIRESEPSLQSARMGTGQLISAAEKVGLVPGDVLPQLRYAVGVANKAIHGEPVDVGVALEAVDSADYALRRIAVQGGRPPGGVN